MGVCQSFKCIYQNEQVKDKYVLEKDWVDPWHASVCWPFWICYEDEFGSCVPITKARVLFHTSDQARRCLNFKLLPNHPKVGSMCDSLPWHGHTSLLTECWYLHTWWLTDALAKCVGPRSIIVLEWRRHVHLAMITLQSQWNIAFNGHPRVASCCQETHLFILLYFHAKIGKSLKILGIACRWTSH